MLLGFLAGCKAPLSVSEVQKKHYELRTLPADSATAAIIDPYKKKLDAEMNTVIAVSDTALGKDGLVPNLANFVLLAIDDYVKKAHPEIAGSYVSFMNRGGLRASLPRGNVTLGNIFELMPFDNAMVVLQIKGEKLRECVEIFCKNKKLLSWHLSFGIHKDRPTDILVCGKPLDEQASYTIVTTDYLAGGGDESVYFASPLSYTADDVKLRDVLIGYCKDLTKQGKHITSYSDDRIRGHK